jgi:type II secretory pathway pseudopilin PulG
MRPNIVQEPGTRCACVRFRSLVTPYMKTLSFVGCDERMRRHTACMVERSGDSHRPLAAEESPLIRPLGHLLPRFRGRRDSWEASDSNRQRRLVNLACESPRVRLNRGGYTLVEMLIAAVLVAALMSVVWGMMSMYNSYLTAGQAQATEQQLTRSLLQMLERDLQSVSAPDTNPKVVPSLEITSESSSFDEPPAPLVDPSAVDPLSNGTDPALNEPSVFAGFTSGDTLAIPSQVSLVGNSSSLKLSIEQPIIETSPVISQTSDNSNTSAPAVDSAIPAVTPTPEPIVSPEDSISVEGVAPEVAEYQTIVWQFQAPGMITGNQSLQAGLYRIQTESLSLQSALNQQDSLLEDSAAESDASVDRTTLETLLFPPADAQAESGGATPTAEAPVKNVPKFDLIPEVVSCRFEYFNGSSWASTWNSEQQQSLPLAIRVRMQLVNAADLEKLKLVFGDSTSQDSPLDDATDGSPSTVATSPATPESTEDPTVDPLAAIRTRKVEHIILLQPVTGPMPEPGTGSEVSEPEASL